MSQAQQAAAECTLGRSWPDRRLSSERRKPLDTKVDIDPTQAWLGDMDRRHAERRQYAARPALPSNFGAFA